MGQVVQSVSLPYTQSMISYKVYCKYNKVDLYLRRKMEHRQIGRGRGRFVLFTVEHLWIRGHILFSGQLLDGIPADKVLVNYY